MPFQRAGPSFRIERLAHERVDAVGADQHVAVRGVAVGAVAVEEVGRHPALVLTKRAEPMAGVNARLADARPRGVIDDALQPAAMNGELRHLVARIGAARLAPDLLAEAVGVDELVGPDRHRVEPVEQPKLLELLDGVRQRVDADAELANAVGLLVDLAVDPARMQHQRGGETPDTATDDNDLHDATPGSLRLLSTRLLIMTGDVNDATASARFG